MPAGATLVVFHSAVLAYLSDDERARFAATVRDLPGHWVSNEGPRVLPDLVRADVPAGSAVGPAPFVLALDGEQVAWAEGHGRAVHWLVRPRWLRCELASLDWAEERACEASRSQPPSQ